MKTEAPSIWTSRTTRQFVEVMTALEDIQVMQNFLRDVMTEKEIIEVSARLEAARMLWQGKKYAEIIEVTKLSSRTVARISDWMQNGTGGYRAALEAIADHHEHLPPARA